MTDVFSFSGLFEVVCFLFLIGTLRKIFLKNVVGSLKEALQNKEDHFAKLKETYSQAQQDNQTAVEHGIEQEELAKKLLKKIKLWHEGEQERFRVLKQEHKRAEERIQDYLDTKLEAIKIDHARQELLPEAIEKAQRQLIKKFEDPAAQEAFLKEVLPTAERDNA